MSSIKANKSDRLKVFLSYSHKDSEWAERLMAHLNTAESQGLVQYWSDKLLCPGDEWQKKVKEEIEKSKVFVILLSPEYLASQFSSDVEFPLIKEASDDGALIIPVLIKPVSLSAYRGLQEYQFSNNEALSELPPRQQERLIIDIAQRINVAIMEHKKKTDSNSGQVLASTIGGAVIGNILIPGVGGAILGGLLGGVLGNSKKGGKKDA